MTKVHSYVAHAGWMSRHGARGLTITRQEPVAVLPMSGTGRPTTAGLDDALATLGFTRVTPWMDSDEGLVCGLEPVRR
jgi:hypothetical protein